MRCSKRSIRCRGRAGAIPTRLPKRRGGPCARRSGQPGTRSPCVTSTCSRYNPDTMIGRLNHVAIAVSDLAKASRLYRELLGAEVSAPVAQPEHGVTTVFITLPNTKIELIAPLGASSPIAKFLERSPGGGMHHVCYEV